VPGGRTRPATTSARSVIWLRAGLTVPIADDRVKTPDAPGPLGNR